MWAVVMPRWVRCSSQRTLRENWYYDSEGNKTYTMFKKRNPIMEGFRKWRLHGPKVAASPSEACSLGEAVLSLVAAKKDPTTFHYKG